LDVAPVSIISAAERIRPFVLKTPFEPSDPLGSVSGGEIYLKMENMQRTGSFKARGAFNRLMTMTDSERRKGVFTVSAGNHAQGIGLAARTLGIRAAVVMPRVVPHTKVTGTRRYGVEVTLAGADYDEAEAIGAALAAESGMTFVSAYSDAGVVAGQGTVGLEMMLERPDLDSVLVPAGGGGLISGVSCIVKALNPSARVYGVQSEASHAWAESFRAGRATRVRVTGSLAEGLSGQITQEMFELAMRWVDGFVVVSEAEIAGAMRWLAEEHHLLVEGSGAVGVAAVLNRRADVGGKRVGIVLTGGNVDMSLFRDILGAGARDDSSNPAEVEAR
jgi:threonine dehydratase